MTRLSGHTVNSYGKFARHGLSLKPRCPHHGARRAMMMDSLYNRKKRAKYNYLINASGKLNKKMNIS